MTASSISRSLDWIPLCQRSDLVPFSGVAAWIDSAEGPAQVALFYLPGHSPELFAIDHHDPIAKVNVLARGIVGDIQGEPVVASPLYKQHFRLKDGSCVEDASVSLRTWAVAFDQDSVMIAP